MTDTAHGPSARRAPGRTIGLTVLALVGFAANSVLCRLALRETAISPAFFTIIRLASGTGALVMLTVLPAAFRRGRAPARPPAPGGSWISASALFAYAAAFSFAYVTLSTAAGALLLFGAVQITMIAWGLRSGERLTALQVVGVLAAAAGVAQLLSPGWVAPSIVGGALMVAAGVAWGVYSIRGRGSTSPLSDTAGNFARALALSVILLVSTLGMRATTIDERGALLAVASGALASGVGYAIWYAALPHLPTTLAATAQLAVPLLATVGGALAIGEPVTARVALPGVAILGGLALVFLGRAVSPAPARVGA